LTKITLSFSTLTTTNRAYDTLSLALLVYRANENRKRCVLLSEVTQTNLRNIENFKTKTTGTVSQMSPAHQRRDVSIQNEHNYERLS
jgi:hypothetical protein